MSLCSFSRLFCRKSNCFDHGGGKYNFSSCQEAQLQEFIILKSPSPWLLFVIPPVLEPDKSFPNRYLTILLPGSSDSNIVLLTTIKNLTWPKGSQWSHLTFSLPFNSLFSSIKSQLLQGGLFFFFLPVKHTCSRTTTQIQVNLSLIHLTHSFI